MSVGEYDLAIIGAGAGGLTAYPLDRERSVLAQWMRRSLAFTRAMPPKAKKAASAKKTKKAKR